MIAAALHFSRADLLEAEWGELVELWLPEAIEIRKESIL